MSKSRGEGVLPYKNDRGIRRNFWKEPLDLKGTRISINGRGAKYFSLP